MHRGSSRDQTKIKRQAIENTRHRGRHQAAGEAGIELGRPARRFRMVNRDRRGLPI